MYCTKHIRYVETFKYNQMVIPNNCFLAFLHYLSFKNTDIWNVRWMKLLTFCKKQKNCIVEWQQQQVNNHCMLVDLNLRITNVHCPLQDWPTALPFSDISISDTGALTRTRPSFSSMTWIIWKASSLGPPLM